MMKYSSVVILVAYMINGCAHYHVNSVTGEGELNSQLTYLPYWQEWEAQEKRVQ